MWAIDRGLKQALRGTHVALDGLKNEIICFMLKKVAVGLAAGEVAFLHNVALASVWVGHVYIIV